jgi:heavy metal sensor kinase
MKMSFRVRLVLIITILTGILLSCFIVLIGWRIHDEKMKDLDNDIRSHIERELSKRRDLEHWSRQQNNISRSMGAYIPDQIALWVENTQIELFRSTNWPENVDPSQLPWRDPQNHDDILDQNDSHPHKKKKRQLVALTLITVEFDHKPWRMGLGVTPTGDKMAMGVDMEMIDTELADFHHAILFSVPLMLGLLGLSAWFISGCVLTPIRKLSTTMSHLTVKELGQRIDLENKDKEFAQLIDIFNSMLERLERSFHQTSRFSADAAHELKTPLTILQGQIERAIFQSDMGSVIQKDLALMLDEVQRLDAIVRNLLLFSLADAGQLRLNKQDVDLSLMLANLLEDAQMLAPNLTIDGLVAENLVVKADADLLIQVLHNLLSNAIKYNIPNGWIRIEANRTSNYIEVIVSNSSLGIAEADLELIFERFYRCESSHNRKVDGMGLGLSLSRDIIHAHHGKIDVSTDQSAVSFLIHLPLNS